MLLCNTDYIYNNICIGIAITGTLLGDQIVSGNLLTDYSYINPGVTNTSVLLARCLTGLGPSNNDDNTALGGWYFNGTRIANGECTDSVIKPNGAPIFNFVGVINLFQCRTLTTFAEGVYTCIIMNSLMLNQSVRLGLYLTGRSKSIIHVHTYMYTYIHAYLCMHVCICVHTYMHTCIQIYTHIHAHIQNIHTYNIIIHKMNIFEGSWTKFVLNIYIRSYGLID